MNSIEILCRMDKESSPHTARQWADLWDVAEDARQDFFGELDRLLADEKLIETGKRKIGMPKMLDMQSGRIQANVRGFAFFIPDDVGRPDMYLASERLAGAMHRDRVLVRRIPGADEGEVTRILSRANERMVGTVEKTGGRLVFVPDETRIIDEIILNPKELMNAQPLDKVVVQLTSWPNESRVAKARVIEVLGNKFAPGCDILSVIRQFNLPDRFPDPVLAAARALPRQVTEADRVGREDFRPKAIVTVDGADAKDLDDGVSLEILDNGNYLLGVHIADVGHYVKKGGLIDIEALKRGTSVYMADRVVPMLPAELSNGICSLNAGVERLAFSVLMQINKKGQVVSHRCADSVILIKRRLTYDIVAQCLDGDSRAREELSDIADMLLHMEELMKTLRKARSRRGSIDFDLPESYIEIDSNGHAVDVRRRERNNAHQMIEEFMVLCNETVAGQLFHMEIPALYRVHEAPDGDKIKEFAQFVRNLGFSLGVSQNRVQALELQKLLDEVEGTEVESVVNKVMLRSMKKARYSEQNLGHFGLASKCYCHFTSPIRRYPDLVVHRMLRAALRGEVDIKKLDNLNAHMADLAQQTSEREKIATDAERMADDMKKAEYLSGHIGEQFKGIVSGVANYGFYVELPNTCEGMVRLSSIQDDYYALDEKSYMLLGQRTGRTIRLGDPVEVLVAAADPESRNVDFVLVRDKEKEKTSRKKGKEQPKKKENGKRKRKRG